MQYQKNIILQNNKHTPVLPINGIKIHNAIGEKATKISKQMMIPITIQNLITHAPFIIIEKLNENGILENDFLEKHNAIIDFENRTVRINIRTEKTTIPFTDQKESTPGDETKQITVMKKQPQPNNTDLNQNNYIKSIINRYPEVFREEPGKIEGYCCKLRLKNNTPIKQRPYLIPVTKMEAVEQEV